MNYELTLSEFMDLMWKDNPKCYTYEALEYLYDQYEYFDRPLIRSEWSEYDNWDEAEKEFGMSKQKIEDDYFVVILDNTILIQVG